MKDTMFRKLALALPGVEEAPHFDRTGFHTSKGMFATLKNDKEAMIRLHPAEKAQKWIAAQPTQFFAHGGLAAGIGSLGVHLAKAKVDLVKELLRDAWHDVAPKPKRLKGVAAASEHGSMISLPFDPAAYFIGPKVRANVNDSWVDSTVVSHAKKYWLLLPGVEEGAEVVVSHIMSSRPGESDVTKMR